MDVHETCEALEACMDPIRSTERATAPRGTRSFLVTVLVAALCAALAQVPPDRDEYELPGDGTFPEGIAYDPESNAIFVGGAGSGALYRIHLETGGVTELLEAGQRPPFTTIGLAIDRDGTLWVAGGSSGEVLRFDRAGGGAVRAEIQEPDAVISVPGAEGTFLNDLIAAPNGDVFVTDSGHPVLYRVPAGSDRAEAWLDLTDTVFTYVEGFNANGIVVTDDGSHLIVVNAATGALYLIDVDTQEVAEITVDGEPLVGGDGMVLDGRTLFVVRNGPDTVTVIELSDDLLQGEVVDVIEDERFASTATAALVGDDLLIVNAQFAAMQTGPELPFTVSVVRGVRGSR